MTKCIVTGDKINSENNSKAHIIPSALGGRLKPLGILSDDGNSTLNDKVDLPLIRAFQPIMSLLDGSRDRGENPAIKMTDEAGKSYVVSFNQPLALAQPEFTMNPNDQSEADSVEIKIAARTKKEARTLLGRVKKKYPNFDIEEAMQRAALAESRPTGMIGVQLQIGPNVVFPAAFVAASIFAVHNGLPPHPELANFISLVDPTMTPVLMPVDTFYWYSNPTTNIENDETVTHSIFLITDTARKQALVCVDYFNIVSVGVILPFEGDKNSAFSYAVDVLNGVEVNRKIDDTKIRSMGWGASHQLGDAALYSEIQSRASRVIKIAQERSMSAALSDLIESTLGAPDGRRLTKDDVERLQLGIEKLINR